MRSILLAAAGAALLAPAADAAILWPTARANGTQGNGEIQAINLSPNGNLALFSSAAENLVADGNAHRDVFVRTLATAASS